MFAALLSNLFGRMIEGDGNKAVKKCGGGCEFGIEFVADR